MQRIRLLRNVYLAAYLHALRVHGIETEPLLVEHRIPDDFEFLPDYMLASDLLHRFINAAATHAQPGAISTTAGLFNATSQENPFSLTLPSSVTPLDAIHRHNDNVASFSPDNQFTIELNDTSGRWSKKGRSPISETEIFCIANLIGHVRTVLKPDWLPEVIGISRTKPHMLAGVPLFSKIPHIETDRSTAIVISLEHLGTPIAVLPDLTSANSRRPATETTELDFFESLRLIMRSYARIGQLRIDDTAHAAGLSRRTLQRRLRNAGLTYSILVDQVRYEIASRLLTESFDRSITQIGYELGYNDPGSFSRAFRRFAGASPAQYRRRALSSRSAV